MKRIVAVWVLLATCLGAMAQSKQYAEGYDGEAMHVEAKIIDKIIRKPLPVNVTAMQRDSTIIAQSALGADGAFSSTFPKDSVIVVCFSMVGYESYWLELDYRNSKAVNKNLGNIEMVEKPIELDEVTVKASKIKMVYRGDTIVYNADAFRLTEGSMLDALIEQLPGVELKGSQILVNGRYVESLLVNGKDFFRGDPSVALGNLSAYMVKDIKVYEKEADDAHIVGTMVNKSFVMDVRLKKEYSAGLISNAEIAYGLANRYTGRLFGLLFTDQMRLAMFGNVNNTSDTRQPGTNGDWNPSWQASGVTNMQLGGIEFLWDNKEKSLGVENSLKVFREDEHTETVTSATNFFNDGDTYTRSHNKTHDDQLHIMWRNRLHGKGKYYFFDFRPELEYFHNDITGTNRGARFTAKPSENYRGASLDSIYMPGYVNPAMLYSAVTDNLSIREQLNVKGYLYGSFTFENTRDYITMIINANRYQYDNRNYQHYTLRYGEAGDGMDDKRNMYGDNQRWEKNLSAQFDYNHALDFNKTFLFRPKYTYSYNATNGYNHVYRLERFEEWSPEDKELGMLPSTRDSLSQAMDVINSNNSVLRTHKHVPSLELERRIYSDASYQYYLLRLPLNIMSESNHIHRGDIDTTVNRLSARLEGSAQYNITQYQQGDSLPRREYQWTYNFSNSAPSLSYNIPYVNDANPLSIYINRNDGLRSTHKHNASFAYKRYHSVRQRNFNTGVNASLVRNAIAHYRAYDKATGVTTSWPTNINGNWQASAYYSMSSALDDAERTTFSHGTTAGYVNSVDYISVVGSTADPKSVVRNVNLRESLGFENKWEQSTVYLKANATYRYATGNREDFTTIHAIDYDYGLTLKSELPWGVNLSTDLTMYSRRGYADESMNTDDLVWNARLSKSILKGNLTFIADGFDLLGQLSNIRYSVNAQGIQETWHNVVPRYAMLHVVYRFNKQPKKK